MRSSSIRFLSMIAIISIVVGIVGVFPGGSAQAAATWSKTSSKVFHSIAYGKDAQGNDIYVAFSSAEKGKVYTSTNLTDWTSTDISAVSTRAIKFVNYVNDTFIAGAQRDDMATGGQFLYSTDGASWSGVVNWPSYGFTSVAYGGGVYRMTSDNGRGVVGSPDGQTWSDAMAGSGPRYYDILYINNSFLAAGRNAGYSQGGLRKSSDGSGTTWDAEVVLPKPLYGLASNGTQIVAVGEGGKIYRTDADASPTLPTIEASVPNLFTAQLNSVAYGTVDGAGLYVAGGNGGKLLVSEDGLAWNEEASGATGDFYKVIYAEGTFVAVSGSGVYKRINADPPSVTTSTVTEVSYGTAKIDAEVTSDHGYPVMERGVVYATSPSPTTANGKKASDTLLGSTFQVELDGLVPNTLYYARAYAMNVGGTSYGEEKSFTTLDPVPTDITLSNGSIAENSPIGTTVGTLGGVSAYMNDTFAFSLVSGDGDTDNASFTVNGSGQLLSAASFDFEAKSAYSVRVQAADSNGDPIQKSFAIAVTDVNEAPVAYDRLTPVIAGFDSPAISELSAADADGDPLTFSIVGQPGKGVVTLSDADGGRTFSYIPNEGASGADSFTFKANDGQLDSGTATVQVNIVPAGFLNLGSLSVSAGDLNPAFTSNRDVYALEVGHAVDSLTVSAAVYEADYSIVSIQGVDTGSATVPLQIGSNPITIRVVAKHDPTLGKTYTVNVMRYSDNADLAGLIVSGGSLTPAFSKAETDYRLTVDYSVSRLTVTPSSEESHAAIRVNGTPVASGTASQPIDLVVGANRIEIEVTAQDASFHNLYVVTVQREEEPSSPEPAVPSVPAVPSAPSVPTPPQAGPNDRIEVIVDGRKQEQSATMKVEKKDDRTVATVQLDNDKVMEAINRDGNKVLTIPVQAKADVVVAELNGQLVKAMENKQAVVDIQTPLAAYTLQASQIRIDQVYSAIGRNVELGDIAIHFRIAESPESKAQLVESAASNGNMELVVKPIDFELSASYGDSRVNIDRFDSYVERGIALPDGIDASRITTGVVLGEDGTITHVPTKVVTRDGKPYAVINSLTNSTYSVIWNPRTMADVEGHWSRDDVNDMASRLVVQGVDDSRFEPDRSVTRAEFAAIAVRALGLKPNATEGETLPADVNGGDWYAGYVRTAIGYGLIAGYEDGTFRPDRTITRNEAAVIAARAMQVAKLGGQFTDEETSKRLAAFKDGDVVAEWARSSVAAAAAGGILQGNDEGFVRPQDDVTRAQTAAMLRRLLLAAGLIDSN
ncbi:S-layer homology domain-containing protein [Paenibacillus flagellatus]|uniref:Cadherin-like beta sandwich domain-containing protein n=1 Tax=Paenibacillus flagellatus TaxID=2211139 RepID=A0A2V5JUV2_9BACL|nr:S-layer homology domain-containing protein [Paenibacillus flagellatus]PYI50308.1 hypothetical protein DLM86_30015 [Paenibacillus flagellatus]